MTEIGFKPVTIDAVGLEMAAGTPQFYKIDQREINGFILTARPYVGRAESGDVYFLSRYSVRLEEGEGKKALQALIWVSRSHNFNLETVAKMLLGASVKSQMTNKDGVVFEGWTDINQNIVGLYGLPKVNTYYPGYGYSAEIAYCSYNFIEKNDPVRIKEAVSRMENGELTKGTTPDGTVYLVSAWPVRKTVHVFDIKTGEALTKEQCQLLRVDSMKECEKALNSVKQPPRKGLGVA
jgi:hypothetical protein